MHPAHRCKKRSLSVVVHVEPFQDRVSFRFLSLHHSVKTVPSPFLNLAVSPTFLALHDIRFPCHVFVGCRTASHHDKLGHTDFSTASISCSTKEAVGKSRILHLFVYVLFLPHTIPRCAIGAELPVMNISTKANFSLHCSISVPARNPDTSCLCVELPFTVPPENFS